MNFRQNNSTGVSNATYWFGADPCPHCGGDCRYTHEFHGHYGTFCIHCGEEFS